jgi:hypothetical protein
VLHAVDDLGLDPTGGRAIDDKLESAIDNDTRIEFPAGTYKASGGLTIRGKSNWGLRGLGDEVSDVSFELPGAKTPGCLTCAAGATC